MISLLACFVLSTSLLVREEDAAKAKELVDAVAADLKDAPAIAFESEVRIKIGQAEVVQTVKVQLKRPNLARLEIAGGGQDALILLDGTTSWHFMKVSKGYVKSKQLGTMKIEQYGVGPVATLFFENDTGTLLPYLSNASVRKEKLGEDECFVVTWRVGAEETHLWISGNRIRRFRTTRSIEKNVFEQTFTYGVIELSPVLSEEAFVFVPPKGAYQVPSGDESEFLPVDAEAPEFTVTELDGSTTKLSDFKGKPVLLSFWFYGCATCREELPRLQKLNVEYAKRNLVMLAVNFGDRPETIGAYFEKEKFTIRPVMQKSDEVSRLFGVRSYPTIYVLGRDGKVVWRAVGFDEQALRAALERVAPDQ